MINWKWITFTLASTISSLVMYDFTNDDSIRLCILVTLILFTVFTIYCSLYENLIKTFIKVCEFSWGKQVTIDLYIGLLLFNLFIYLDQGKSLFNTICWLIPSLIFGNIVPLIYCFINYHSIVQRFH